MNPTEMRTLIKQFSADGLVAPSPLVRIGGKDADGGYSPLGVVADLVVDLAEALDHASQIGLEALDIYADTLVLPVGFDRRLDGLLRRLTIVTRRIVAEGTDVGALRMLHNNQNTLSVVRLFVERIEGQFRVYAGPEGNTPYDVAVAAGSSEAPQFANFTWQDGGPALRYTRVPPGLLCHGQPLHRLLASLFALSAAVLGKPSQSAADHRLCHEVLAWITKWSGVESEFGELIRDAENLKALVPTNDQGGQAKPIPNLTTTHYLDISKAQQEVMAAMEDDLRSLDSAGDVSHLVVGVVTAFADRDSIELAKLDELRQELEKRLREQIAALDKASRTMRQEEFDAQIASMRLELETSIAQVKRIVSLSFQIATALITVAASVAALCVGVPPNPQAVTQKGVDGVKGVSEMFTEAQKLGSTIDGPINALLALAKSFAIPITWAKDNASTLKEFVDPAKSVLNALLPVYHGPVRDLDTELLATQLGDAMRMLTEIPNANEAKAAWTVLELDIANRLDLVLNDPDTESAVKKAATAFKTRVQRVAIYGRLLAEQSAAKAAIASQLGALKLECLAVMAKQKRLEAFTQDASDKAKTRERVRAEMASRAESASRGFFVASYGARAAQAYETYRQPTSRLIMVTTSADMSIVLATARTDYATAQAATAKKVGDFTRELRITDDELLKKFSAGQPVRFDLLTDHPDFAKFKRVRLASTQAWAEVTQGAETTQSRVAIELVTGSTFLDPGDRGTDAFFAAPQSLRFEYRGERVEFEQTLHDVLPTPFTTWLIELVEPKQLSGPVQALRIVLKGYATV